MLSETSSITSLTSGGGESDCTEAAPAFLFASHMLAKDWLQAALAARNSIRPTPLIQTPGSSGNTKRGKLHEYDYLADAGEHASMAYQAESVGDFENAFHAYKHCVEILLKGVSLESDLAKRESVRAMTTEYLTKASQIFYTHVAHEPNYHLWLENSLNPTASSLKGASTELSLYRTVQVIGANLLVFNHQSGSKSLLKFIRKPCYKHFDLQKFPSGVPHMAPIEKFYETDDALVFRLKHIPGGLLWRHLEKYSKHHVSSDDDEDDAFSISARTLSASSVRTLSMNSRSSTLRKFSTDLDFDMSNSSFSSTGRSTFATVDDNVLETPTNENGGIGQSYSQFLLSNAAKRSQDSIVDELTASISTAAPVLT